MNNSNMFPSLFCMVVFFGYLTFIIECVHGSIVETQCPESDDICEFYLTLNHHTAMLIYNQDESSDFSEPLVVKGSLFYVRDRSCIVGQVCEDFSKVVTGDGTYKNLILYNRTLPGPPIIVYKGQQVVVRVTNELINEGTLMHFHGLHQRGTPWMDGAGDVSHCPINPGETFTYRFLADEAGTYWYHSHHGTQRTMGAYGPLIVLERSKEEEQKTRVTDPLPDFDKEFYMVVSDYMHDRSEDILLKVKHEAVSYAKGYDIPDDMCYNSTKQPDGLDCGVTPFDSGVINGKGRHYPNRTDEAQLPGIPLETFTVKKDEKYRFRVICASMTFGFRVSIDNHKLNIITVDGQHVKTKTVESITIFSGERLDFWIEAGDSHHLGRYWIRAENLEHYQNNQIIKPGQVKAILQYEGDKTPGADPVSERTCTREDPCTVLNCPFKEYAPGNHLTCIHMTDLESTDNQPTVEPDAQHPFYEFFLNYHFAINAGVWKSSVNGIQHRPPTAPPQMYPADENQYLAPCDEENCQPDGSYCDCTHQIEVPLGAVVQLVILTTVWNPAGTLNGNTHPVHLHGTHLQIVKQGFPLYTVDSKRYLAPNTDFYCEDSACNKIAWTNSSWSSGDYIDGMKMSGAVRKDTVVAPVGGYLIARFKADNPGFWLMHCHTEFHNAEGMALIMKVGEVSDMNPPPPNMPTCGNFHWKSEQFMEAIGGVKSPQLDEDKLLLETAARNSTFMAPPCSDTAFYQLTSLGFGATSLILLVTCMLLWLRLRHYSSKTAIVNGDYTLLGTGGYYPVRSEDSLYQSYQSEQSNVSYVRRNNAYEKIG